MPEHFWLGRDDLCLYYGNYFSGRGYEGEVNQLIQNLKKSPLRRNLPDYKYKHKAIAQSAAILRGGIRSDAFDRLTFVPVPPSKIKGHAEYDDRMQMVVEQLCDGTNGQFCELVTQTESYESSHASDRRQRPTDLIPIYDVDGTATPRDMIFVVDDVLTTGAHFIAMKRVLVDRFPGSQILGLFVARRKLGADETAETTPAL